MTLVDSAAAGLRCPICGAVRYACGGPSFHRAVDDLPGGTRAMAAEVRVMQGTQGFKMTRAEATAYVADHPDAEIQELAARGGVAVAESEPTPEPAPEPEPEPAPPAPSAEAPSGPRRTGTRERTESS